MKTAEDRRRGTLDELRVLGELDGYTHQDELDYSRREDVEMRSRSEAGSVIDRAVDDLLSKDVRPGKVFSIYGIGGQGKSYLLKAVHDSLVERGNDNVVAPFHSFDGDETMTTELLLKRIAELLEFHGIPCPNFSMAYYAFRAYSPDIRHAVDEFLGDYESWSKTGLSETVTSVLEETAPIFDLLSVALGSPLPSGSIYSSIAKLVRRSSEETVKMTTEERWRSLAKRLSASELSKLLVPMLKKDITAWVDAHPGKRLVMFLDTFEKLGWASSDRRGRYEWVRRLSLTPGTLWVVAGRVRVPWENVIQFPVQLVELTHEEVVSLLDGEGITDTSLQYEIERLTRGLPVYISVCVDILKDEDATVERLREVGARERLPELYLKYLGENVAAAAYVASFLESWNLDLIIAATKDIVTTPSIEALNEVSFVMFRGDRWEMHEVVAEVLRSSDGISILKRQLWRRLCEMRDETMENKSLSDVARQQRVTHILKSIARLQDEGVPGVSRDKAFWKYMEYAEEVWSNGEIDSALSLFSSILAKFGSEDDPNPEYLQAKLKEGAIETQLYLAGRGVEHHMRAIELAEEVLIQARAKFPENAAIIQSALNDLGVSWARLGREDVGNYQKALSYQEALYHEIAEKPLGSLTADEARFVNNYGSTCQQYGDALDDQSRKHELYKCAKDAYRQSYEARKRLFGENSRPTLLTLTNLGVIHARLGDLDEAESIVRVAKLGYERAGFAQTYPGYVRCSFQLANFAMQRGTQDMGKEPAEALGILEGALGLHRDVYKIRAESTSPDSIDARKSFEQIAKCEELIEELKGRLV